MEILFEIIAELFFEGLIAISNNKNTHWFLRCLCFSFIFIFFAGMIAFFIFVITPIKKFGLLEGIIIGLSLLFAYFLFKLTHNFIQSFKQAKNQEYS